MSRREKGEERRGERERRSFVSLSSLNILSAYLSVLSVSSRVLCISFCFSLISFSVHTTFFSFSRSKQNIKWALSVSRSLFFFTYFLSLSQYFFLSLSLAFSLFLCLSVSCFFSFVRYRQKSHKFFIETCFDVKLWVCVLDLFF